MKIFQILLSLPLLFTDGRLGERAGGESSSELATVLMASWYSGVELGIANLDMRDIMMERGFWDKVGSGGMVYGLPDGTLPERDMEPDGAPDEGGAEGGPFPPRGGNDDKYIKLIFKMQIM